MAWRTAAIVLAMAALVTSSILDEGGMQELMALRSNLLRIQELQRTVDQLEEEGESSQEDVEEAKRRFKRVVGDQCSCAALSAAAIEITNYEKEVDIVTQIRQKLSLISESIKFLGISIGRFPTGPRGSPGAHGPPGDVGPTGMDGPSGQTSVMVQRGVPGPPGPAGSRGESGPKGPNGDCIKGDTGPRGDRGKPGQNIPGDRGLPGNVGDSGTSMVQPQYNQHYPTNGIPYGNDVLEFQNDVVTIDDSSSSDGTGGGYFGKK